MVAKIEINVVMRNEIAQRRQMEGEWRIAKEQAEKANFPSYSSENFRKMVTGPPKS